MFKLQIAEPPGFLSSLAKRGREWRRERGRGRERKKEREEGGVGERGGCQQHIERQRSLVSHKGYYPRNVTPKGQRLLLSTSLDDMLSRQQNVPKTHGGRSGGLVGVPGIFTSRQATLTG